MHRKPIKRRRNKRPALASPEDAAKVLGISRNLIYLLLNAEVLPANRIGRRFWISWTTLDQVRNGELRLKMAA
jgi:excisionase family DNA binding protein